MSYPVTFEADYVEERSRLTAFFRLILVIPVAISRQKAHSTSR